MMPAEWTMDTLPRPNNPEISLREVPGEMLATLRFSGRGGETKFQEKEAALIGWVSEQGYDVIGAARYAGYNSPFVPGPFRRNEVMIPVRKAD